MHSTETTIAGRQRYSIRKAIETLKAEIPLETYAGEITELRPQGANLVGICPIHDERTPSFAVYPDGHFYCFGCKHHGDLIDLCELVERHGDTWTAVLSLSERFGVELPARPERWRHWTGEKERRRKALLKVRAEHYQRHLFHLFKKDLAAIEDEEFRREEARRLWKATGYLGRRFAHDAT